MNYHTSIGDPVDELKTTKLWNRLQELDNKKADNLCYFVRLIAPVLKSISDHFPLYTRHDCHHGYEVIERMSQVIIPELLIDSENGLNAEEIFCLIVAAYAHDVGMALFEEDNEKSKLLKKLKLPYNVEPDNAILTSFLRENHADRGLKFLRSSEIGKYIPDHLKGIIGGIMESHNINPRDLKIKADIAAIGRRDSDPRALSILLCCADAIEFSDTRVIDLAFREAEIRNDEDAKKSLIEMRKHKSIGCGIGISEKGLIIATGDFNDAQVLNVTHTTLDQIQDWIKEYIFINNSFKRPVLRLTNHAIVREFTTDGFTYYPIAIKIDEYQIEELLTSNKLWGSEIAVPIIELVQNSVEACRYRKHVLPMVPYEPLVEIIFDFDKRKIIVLDNGCGMDELDVTGYFLQIGKSKSRDIKFQNNPLNTGFASFSRFGVGFWSIFSIADKVNVTTRIYRHEEANGLNFNVSIYPVMRFLEIKKDSAASIGTKIEITLKDGIDFTQILEGIERAIKTGAVPIIIKDNNNTILKNYETHLKKAESIEFYGYRYKNAEAMGMEWFNHEIDDDEIEFRIGIAYRKINGEHRCLSTNGEPLFNIANYDHFNNIIISICGFRVGFNIGEIPFALGRAGILRINIKSPQDLIYSFNKQSLIENDMYKHIQDKIKKYLSQSLEIFYSKLMILNDPKKIKTIISDSRSSGGEAGDTMIPDLYQQYETYYNKITPISVIFWEKIDASHYNRTEKTMLLNEFWKIDSTVAYACIWPPLLNDFGKLESFCNSIISESSLRSGYILLASQEASAIIDVALSAKVNITRNYYYDWTHATNQYIEILPNVGFSYDNKSIIKIAGKWTGDVSALQFNREKNNKPWMAFGRHRMFVDTDHDFIKKLIELYKKGLIWEAGNLLSLMAAHDESCLAEIERLTGINPRY